MEVENDTYYSLTSALPGHTLVLPTLTIILAEHQARIRTTLGDTVTVERVDFIRLVRWILRENDTESPDTLKPGKPGE